MLTAHEIHEIARLTARYTVELMAAEARSSPAQRPQGAVRFERLTIDLAHARAAYDGKPIVMKPQEFGLFAYLASNAGQLVTRMQIVNHLSRPEKPMRFNYVDLLIVRLRQKLPSRDWIVTIPKEGFIFKPPA
jgi:DNA-binding response OmpR family regulator